MGPSGVLRCPTPTVLGLWASSSFSTGLAFSYFSLPFYQPTGTGRHLGQTILYWASPSHYDELKVAMPGAITLEAHSGQGDRSCHQLSSTPSGKGDVESWQTAKSLAGRWLKQNMYPPLASYSSITKAKSSVICFISSTTRKPEGSRHAMGT